MNLIDRISHQFEDNMRASLEALELLAAPIAGALRFEVVGGGTKRMERLPRRGEGNGTGKKGKGKLRVR